MLNYRLPSYGTFSTNLKVQYLYGLPQVEFSGLSMDIDKLKNQRISKTTNKDEGIAFSQSIGARQSAMEHLVPEQMFSTETEKAQGISTVKALAIASAQGQKIWTISQKNLNTAMSQLMLSAEAENDIRNAVNAGKVVTAHEQRINFSGWVGEGYSVIDPKTGAGGYLLSGGSNGGEIGWDGFKQQIYNWIAAIAAFFEKIAYIDISINLFRNLSCIVGKPFIDQLLPVTAISLVAFFQGVLVYVFSTAVFPFIAFGWILFWSLLLFAYFFLVWELVSALICINIDRGSKVYEDKRYV